MRACSGCTLCCKLLPITHEKTPHFEETVQRMIEVGMTTPEDMRRMTPDFDKPAGKRCPHQQTGKGCAIYSRRPFGCRFWSCRWLVNDDTADLSRPDRSHYVIDISPDFVTNEAEDGTRENIAVIQVWVDPKYPDAHRDPKLRAFLDRRGKEGYAALIRFSSDEAMFVVPPSMNKGEWYEHGRTTATRHEHSMEEKLAALGPVKVNVMIGKE